MRMSADPRDPGYAAWRRIMRRARVLVTIDGVEHRRVITADTKRRTAVVYQTDGRGNLDVNQRRSRVRREQIVGDIEIRMVPRGLRSN